MIGALTLAPAASAREIRYFDPKDFKAALEHSDRFDGSNFYFLSITVGKSGYVRFHQCSLHFNQNTIAGATPEMQAPAMDCQPIGRQTGYAPKEITSLLDSCHGKSLGRDTEEELASIRTGLASAAATVALGAAAATGAGGFATFMSVAYGAAAVASFTDAALDFLSPPSLEGDIVAILGKSQENEARTYAPAQAIELQQTLSESAGMLRRISKMLDETPKSPTSGEIPSFCQNDRNLPELATHRNRKGDAYFPVFETDEMGAPIARAAGPGQDFIVPAEP